MVTTTDHVASSVAATVLARGGNAADAAIACAAALSVIAQHQCGMGGDAFVLVHDAEGAVHALDASGRAGTGADAARARAEGLSRLPLRMDVRSATVPGAVAGWCALHDRFGSWDWGDLLAPAIDLAERGFAASPTLVRDLRGVIGVGSDPDFGRVQRAGQWIRRPETAHVLRAIARSGRSGFYRGAFAQGLVALGQGEFTDSDLDETTADWVEPLSKRALGATIWTVPPASQGYLVLTSAAIVDRLEVPHDPADPVWAHALVEASRLAGVDRDDRLFEGADLTPLLHDETLDEMASKVDPAKRRQFSDTSRVGDTNAFAIVDRHGMGISFVHSNAHGFGSHLVVPGTGIYLHDRGIGFSLRPGHPAEYGPRKRPPHTLAPVMATDQAGTLRVIAGTMGADSQPQVLLQLLHRLLVVGEDPATALAAGRWFLAGPVTEHFPFDTWLSSGDVRVHVERQAPQAWHAGLRARGHDTHVAEAFDVLAGYAQAIVAHDGGWMGASDPRALSGATIGR